MHIDSLVFDIRFDFQICGVGESHFAMNFEKVTFIGVFRENQ